MIPRKAPKDLIQILIEKKKAMYAKEQKMLQMRELHDRNYKDSITEFQSSEEENEEENYAWFNDKDPANYFCLCTRTKNMIEKDQQVFVCYGRRTNRYLLCAYGFCLK